MKFYDDKTLFKRTLLGIAVAALILTFDLLMPLGAAGGVPYVALVLLGFWFPRRWHLFALAAAATALTILGYFLSPAGGVPWVVLANRALALLVIWITAFLVAQYEEINEDLKRQTTPMELLCRVVVIANETVGVTEALRSCLEEICAYTGWPIGHVYELSPATPNLLVPTTTWHFDRPERFVDFRKVTEQTSFELGTGLPGLVLESQKPAWIRNVTEDKNFPRAKLTKDIKAYSGFAMPIFVRKKVVAVLEFFSTRIEEPDKKLIRVMGHIGTQIGRLVECKQAMESLLRSKVEAEASSRAKTDFLANMSHELRTPLNSIIGFADALRLGQLGVCSDIKCGGYLNNIHESGLHLNEVIDAILDVSRIEAGEAKLSEGKIDAAETIHSCAAMVAERARNAGLSLSVDVAESMPEFDADPTRVKQILLNLLANAIKFTPQGGRITVGAGLDDEGAVIIEVADSGIGIAADDIPKVLQPFAQVEDIMTRSHEGAGLGLPLAISLMELHGGALAIDSEVDQGTTVTMRFPPERTLR